MMTLPFVKMHGLGNDYVYVDCTRPQTADTLKNKDLGALALRVARPHLGIGSDGLVLIMPSLQADFRMRIFNADGLEAQMCGNASRCIGKYVYEHGLTDKTALTLETAAGIKQIYLCLSEDNTVERVSVNMGLPRVQVLADCVEVDMGNPHVVFFDREEPPRRPSDVNIECVQCLDSNHLRMRVWERGSGETMACGTGACAALAAAVTLGRCEREAIVHLAGGDLQVAWDATTEEIWQAGPAVEVFSGEYYED